jgi:hypothetical protein
MDYLAILLLPFAAAGIVYATLRHRVDGQVAGGIAAVAVVFSLILMSGDPSSGVNFADIFVSPVRVLEAYGNVIGYWPTFLLLVVGALLGLVPGALADRRERQYKAPDPSTTRTVQEPPATNPNPAPPTPPTTNAATGPPEPASPATQHGSFGSQEQPRAPNAPEDPTASQSANETTPPAERRLVVCSACRQLFRVEMGRDSRCPNCGTAVHS